MAKPLQVHLDLTELVAIERPALIGSRTSDRTFGITKGPKFNEDSLRPGRVLDLVKSLYQNLASEIQIALGTGRGANRCIKVRYVSGITPDRMGRAAQAVSRTKGRKFTQHSSDAGSRVSGYVYEGAILANIEDHLLEEPDAGVGIAEIENIVATIVAHELGHNLGLEHVKQQNDIMFAFAGHAKPQRVQWLTLASKGRLAFSEAQLQRVRQILAS
jgi:hypothetical protein